MVVWLICINSLKIFALLQSEQTNLSECLWRLRIPPNKHVFYGPGDFVLGWGSTGRKVNIEQFFFQNFHLNHLTFTCMHSKWLFVRGNLYQNHVGLGFSCRVIKHSSLFPF